MSVYQLLEGCRWDAGGTIVERVLALLILTALSLWMPPNANASSLIFESQLGGTCSVVETSGTLALIGERSHLRILDIENAQAPHVVGELPLPEMIQAIHIENEFAYIAIGKSGVAVVDVSAASSPSVVRQIRTTGYALNVDVANDMCYIASGPAGVEMFSVSPGAPVVPLGAYETRDARDVVRVGEVLYVADYHDGLIYVDVSEPGEPRLLGKLERFGTSMALNTDAQFLYLPSEDGKVHLFDVSAPRYPVRITYVEVAGVPKGISAHGNVAAISSRFLGLQMISFSYAQGARVLGHHSTPGTAASVAFDGKNALVADGRGGLLLFDVLNQNAPSLVSSFGGHPGYAEQMAVSDDIGYIVGWEAIYRVNVSDPARPAALDSVTTPGLALGALIIQDDRLYAANSGYGFDIYEIESGGSLRRLGAFAEDDFFVTGMAVSGSYIFVSVRGTVMPPLRDDKFQIFDVSDAAAPRRISFMSLYLAGGIAVAGDVAYVAGGSAGLHVLDISDRKNPRRISTSNTAGYCVDVTVVDGIAHVADEDAGLALIDVSDPQAPRLIGAYDTHKAAHVAVDSGLAFVADGESGLQVIDVSDPARPFLRASYDTGWSAQSVTLSHGHVYVCDGEGGLVTLRYDRSLAGSFWIGY